MNRKKKWIINGIGLSLLLGGCMNMDNANGNGVDEKKNTQAEVKAQYARVQDYKGEGYTLINGKENDKIAEENREEVEKAVKDFFLKKYKTDVEVHNIVGNEDGATVYVESKGRLHFYTYAVVPIDTNQKKVRTSEVMSVEGQVENAIRGSLYAHLYKKEFQKLDQYFEKITSEGKVTGKRIEAIQNVEGSGYMTPYYFVSTFNHDDQIKPVYDLYLNDPDISDSELKEKFDYNSFKLENLKINVSLFMKKNGADPNKEIFEKISSDLESLEGIPNGTYSFFLNDNKVSVESSEGIKGNSLKRAYPDYIVNEIGKR
ncbi:DUF1672 family protein [Bacillus salacetis]|uniref:DUF1672 family protein n=1 Tax=Bacillus salacetis TaxID=2315464 RepID=A0A3A1QW57_9BACI|nr:DUF1672 family protein [Bacillus salacetis]RIW32561.1 DUF1672 family protein [Bacillus salacetis]